jgi:hypothetical protein
MAKTPSEATAAGLLSLRLVEEQYDLKPEKVRAAVKARRLEGHAVGRQLFVERSALESWIKQGAPHAPLAKGAGDVHPDL